MTEPTPIGPHEIAVMLKVTRQRVNQLMSRDDFPEPWAVLKTGRIWRETDIATWAKTRDRRPRIAE